MKQSLWLENVPTISAPSLKQSLQCDICIIGGGLNGIYNAYLLAKKGFDVVLIEALSEFSHGTTAFSTGKLTAQHSLIYSSLTTEQGKLYYEANHSAIERALETNPPSFSRATSFLYTGTSLGKEQLAAEAECYKKIGIPYVATNVTELDLSAQLALGMKGEGQINPFFFAQHFVKLARQFGAEIYLNTRVTQIHSTKNYVTTEHGHDIQYKKLLLCTHYPIESLRRLYSVKLQVDRSYLTATKCTQLLQEQYISIDEQSRTMRTALINNIPYFIYGGRSHTAGTVTHTEPFYSTLRAELQNQFGLPAPKYSWSAQDIQTPDKIPYIGQLSPNDDSLYIATGFNKWGLSTALVAGEILSNLISKTPHPATELFSPSRSNFGSKLYFMIQTGGFVGKEFIKGHVTRANAPRCTHLGCKTRWNDADRTWDCPCHGSRYDEHGQVIEGPAVYPLDMKKLQHGQGEM